MDVHRSFSNHRHERAFEAVRTSSLRTSVALAIAYWTHDAAIFAALGEGDMALNAKLIFCMCDAAPEFSGMVEDFLSPINWLASLVLAVALATSVVLFCVCCCIQDADRYYDPELL